MAAISLKLSEDLLEASGRCAHALRLTRAEYIRHALEEMNRDGVTSVPPKVRAELRGAVELMPDHVREPLRDAGHVQDTLDSLFEVQERLFRWRFPDWDDNEPDEFEFED